MFHQQRPLHPGTSYNSEYNEIRPSLPLTPTQTRVTMRIVPHRLSPGEEQERQPSPPLFLFGTFLVEFQWCVEHHRYDADMHPRSRTRPQDGLSRVRQLSLSPCRPCDSGTRALPKHMCVWPRSPRIFLFDAVPCWKTIFVNFLFGYCTKATGIIQWEHHFVPKLATIWWQQSISPVKIVYTRTCRAQQKVEQVMGIRG